MRPVRSRIVTALVAALLLLGLLGNVARADDPGFSPQWLVPEDPPPTLFE
jgi:hypothetical protein